MYERMNPPGTSHARPNYRSRQELEDLIRLQIARGAVPWVQLKNALRRPAFPDLEATNAGERGRFLRRVEVDVAGVRYPYHAVCSALPPTVEEQDGGIYVITIYIAKGMNRKRSK